MHLLYCFQGCQDCLLKHVFPNFTPLVKAYTASRIMSQLLGKVLSDLTCNTSPPHSLDSIKYTFYTFLAFLRFVQPFFFFLQLKDPPVLLKGLLLSFLDETKGITVSCLCICPYSLPQALVAYPVFHRSIVHSMSFSLVTGCNTYLLFCLSNLQPMGGLKTSS